MSGPSVDMIPWPSSSLLQSTAIDAATDKDLRFLRNQTCHIRNLLKLQDKELDAQRELLKDLVNEIKVQRRSCLFTSSASPEPGTSPMYVHVLIRDT